MDQRRTLTSSVRISVVALSSPNQISNSSTYLFTILNCKLVLLFYFLSSDYRLSFLFNPEKVLWCWTKASINYILDLCKLPGLDTWTHETKTPHASHGIFKMNSKSFSLRAQIKHMMLWICIIKLCCTHNVIKRSILIKSSLLQSTVGHTTYRKVWVKDRVLHYKPGAIGHHTIW